MTREEYEQRRSELWKVAEEKQRIGRDAVAAVRSLEQRWKQEEEARMLADYRLRPEHIALLKRMTFKSLDGGDFVSIGVSGKRPFGNTDWVEDIADILDWPRIRTRDSDDELTEEQADEAHRLMRQLWILSTTTNSAKSVGLSSCPTCLTLRISAIRWTEVSWPLIGD